jgi:hypothetical protein
MQIFKAFQLIIAAEMFFPELLELAHNNCDIDVVIKYGLVSANGLDEPLQIKPYFQAKKDYLWLNVENVARFLVVSGKEIIIEPYANADEDSIRLFVLGSCFGALLMQREYYLLHGNAVKIGEHAVSFVGLSGAGKSTISGILFKRGYSILADDVCAVNRTGEVLPSFPQIKLWSDAVQQLGMNAAGLRKIRPTMEKYAIPLASKFYPNALPLKMIYILTPHNQLDTYVTNVTGVHKYASLQQQSYRRLYATGLMTNKVYRQRCMDLSKNVDLAKIYRPNIGYDFDNLVACVEQDLAQRGLL